MTPTTQLATVHTTMKSDDFKDQCAARPGNRNLHAREELTTMVPRTSSTLTTAKTTYVIRRQLRQEHDSFTAAVFDVLVHHAHDGVVEMSHQAVATEAQVSKGTVRTAIRKLDDSGYIKGEHQFQDNRQRVNRYRFPSYIWDVMTKHLGATTWHPSITPSIQVVADVVVDEEVVKDALLSTSPGVVVPLDSEPGAGLRPAVAAGSPKITPMEPEANDAVERPLSTRWISRTSPMPTVTSMHHDILDLDKAVLWLTAYFEGFIVDHANAGLAPDKNPKTSVGPVRREKLFSHAVDFLQSSNAPSLPEVASVVDWVFNVCGGYLPFLVETHDGDREHPKITNLKLITKNFSRLQAMARSGAQPPAPLVAPEKPRPNLHYGEPLKDAQIEDQAQELMFLWSEFRHSAGQRDIFHTETWRWLKSFRIALVHHQLAFEDLKDVVEALADKDVQKHLEIGKFKGAYDLIRDGQWLHIQSAVTVAVAKAQQDKERVGKMRTSLRNKSFRRMYDDDDE